MLDSAKNGYKLYLKTRPTASKESYVRAKEISSAYIGMHPRIVEKTGKEEVDRQVLLRSISQFRPAETVFEVGKRGGKSAEAIMMVKRRMDLQEVIKASKETRAEVEDEMVKRQMIAVESRSKSEVADEEEIEKAFPSSKKRKRVDEGLWLDLLSRFQRLRVLYVPLSKGSVDRDWLFYANKAGYLCRTSQSCYNGSEWRRSGNHASGQI